MTYDERRVKAIAPKIDGWVEQLYVNYTGQAIAIGEPLLTIYSPMLVSAQQELLVATRLEQNMSQADADVRRGAQELRDAARRRLQYWDISDEQIGELERTGAITKTLTLRAPVEGVVVEKRVLAGQRIMAGEALYQVADLRVVWLEGEVFERDLASIRLGQGVSAEFEAFPGVPRTGRVTYIYPTLDPDTRTVRIRVELPNRDLQLKPGMYSTIRLQTVTSAATLVVPRSAVLATGERRLVFVRRADGMLEPRDVEIGLSTDQFTQVLRGLSRGDTVVRSATFLVDAESNLSSALGGMGAMPGMDMAPPSGGGTAPPKSGGAPRRNSSAPPPDSSGRAGARRED
ncbi:MAG: efflux RND transporter periplasmic adaptor subunit [Gemmatimonadetes bacterium]|nr:efflux RND transporter periplasmic adaptor subunit [Gemmatimonadota bacterium]